MFYIASYSILHKTLFYLFILNLLEFLCGILSTFDLVVSITWYIFLFPILSLFFALSLTSPFLFLSYLFFYSLNSNLIIPIATNKIPALMYFKCYLLPWSFAYDSNLMNIHEECSAPRFPSANILRKLCPAHAGKKPVSICP